MNSKDIFKPLLIILSLAISFTMSKAKDINAVQNETYKTTTYIPIANVECKMFFEGEPPSDKNYQVFWDGACKNGYADGLGREFSTQGIEIIGIYKNTLPQYYYYTDINDTTSFIGSYTNKKEGIFFNSDNPDTLILVADTFYVALDKKTLRIQDKSRRYQLDKIKPLVVSAYIKAQQASWIIESYKEKICMPYSQTHNHKLAFLTLQSTSVLPTASEELYSNVLDFISPKQYFAICNKDLSLPLGIDALYENFSAE